MESNLHLFLMFVMLLGYGYTLTYAHILLARVDRQVSIERHISGEITQTAIATTKSKFKGPELTDALSLLRANQVIICLFFILLLLM